MKEFVEKLIGRLEEEKEGARGRNAFDSELSFSCAIKIVNQLAEEYNNGWIPCSERLPEKYGEYFVWWTDITQKEYCEITEYHPQEGWIGDIPQAVGGKYTVIAWCELPEPYKPEGE